jgi:uncharacterized protein
MMLTETGLIIAGLAAFAAGVVNALAGGGTLISFPALVALGIPEISANVTNTVALCPGYLGGTVAQKGDLKGQKQRLWVFLPIGMAGGIIGAILLLFLDPRVFRFLIPFLILGASLLLAVQDPLKDWIRRRSAQRSSEKSAIGDAIVPVGLATVYGGYFGAGQSILILAVLGIFVDDTLQRLNALKQGISFASNIAAAVFFLFSGMVVWEAAVVMVVCAFAGGAAGGRFASRINAELLRWSVVFIGLAIGIWFLVTL